MSFDGSHVAQKSCKDPGVSSFDSYNSSNVAQNSCHSDSEGSFDSNNRSNVAAKNSCHDPERENHVWNSTRHYGKGTIFMPQLKVVTTDDSEDDPVYPGFR